MQNLFNIDLSLPFNEPVIVFAVLLFIVLISPILLNRFKIPHIIGFILIGAIIGPNSLDILERDSSIVLFGSVGLVYLMFMAGLETNLLDFKKNIGRSLVFGSLTFSIPMAIGTFVGLYILNFSMMTSVLLASMFASHTLVTYPIISKFGVTKNSAVGITVGGTIFTDTLALLILAIIADMAVGELTNSFWIRIGIYIILLIAIIMIGVPLLGRWFFKRFDDNISQYIFVLLMVFFSGFLALVAGIEAIIGAFLAGIALNSIIPRTSPLMNRIGFVGNALFIPFFLIGVGMLIDFSVVFKDTETLFVGLVMTVVAIFAKFLAALFTQKIYRLNKYERHIIFGLSNSQAAATLAAVIVGYNIILYTDAAGMPVRLLNDSILNGTLIMILVTCTVSSFVTQKGAKNVAVPDIEDTKTNDNKPFESFLIPLSNPQGIDELMSFALTIKPNKESRIIAMNVLPAKTTNEEDEKNARLLLEKAAIIAASADNHCHTVLRYDLNAANGILNFSKEHKISNIILGFHIKKGIIDSYMGDLPKAIVAESNSTVFIYRYIRPLSTITKFHIIIPEREENEQNFSNVMQNIQLIGENMTVRMTYYGSNHALAIVKNIIGNNNVNSTYLPVENSRQAIHLSKGIKSSEGIIIVMARVNTISYNSLMANIPLYLNKYFRGNNYILIYPRQYEFSEYYRQDYKNPMEFEPLRMQLERIDSIFNRLFKGLRKK